MDKIPLLCYTEVKYSKLPVCGSVEFPKEVAAIATEYSKQAEICHSAWATFFYMGNGEP